MALHMIVYSSSTWKRTARRPISTLLALIYALANALETLAARGKQWSNCRNIRASSKLSLINTVAQGTITGDLKGKTMDPGSETIVDMNGFLDAVERNIAA